MAKKKKLLNVLSTGFIITTVFAGGWAASASGGFDDRNNWKLQDGNVETHQDVDSNKNAKNVLQAQIFGPINLGVTQGVSEDSDDNFQSQIYDADNTQYSEANGKNILQLGLGLNLFGYNQYANGDENAQSQEINEASTQSQVANGKNVAQ